VTKTEPEAGEFKGLTLDITARENVKREEVDRCCLSVETDTARLIPKPAALLQVTKESDLHNEPLQLVKMIRADEEGLPNPFPDIETTPSPVDGTTAKETSLLSGTK